MFGQNDQHTLFYDTRRSSPFLEWEYPRQAARRNPLETDNARYEQMLDEAAEERFANRFDKAPSRTARLSFDFGAWLVKAGCRLERLGFARFGAQTAAATVAVDCGCA